eukprot:TRINITY_DN10047_c0_g2_i2.p1 TRINITY_DN10047_c0_g2~~TRINITY_DN10047_c0_g2_i2.p1  ORF type:complete len:221 (+),score=53.51 TRINITY_DN10047_c0_g2_i2:127-789(+)
MGGKLRFNELLGIEARRDGSAWSGCRSMYVLEKEKEGAALSQMKINALDDKRTRHREALQCSRSARRRLKEEKYSRMDDRAREIWEEGLHNRYTAQEELFSKMSTTTFNKCDRVDAQKGTAKTVNQAKKATVCGCRTIFAERALAERDSVMSRLNVHPPTSHMKVKKTARLQQVQNDWLLRPLALPSLSSTPEPKGGKGYINRQAASAASAWLSWKSTNY